MGVVYRAEDLALERPVAIKMLRPDLAEDTAFVEHLRGEAAMLARLEHPNLVQIYNFGQSGGDSYFVMELLEGEGLQQAVERHRIEGTHDAARRADRPRSSRSHRRSTRCTSAASSTATSSRRT